MIRLVMVVLLLIIAVPVLAAEQSTPSVSVVGVAEKEVVPDEIRWQLSVRTEALTAQEVSKIHVDEVSDVLSLLTELGQEEKSVSTSNMQLGEKWVYRNKTREKDGYYASTNIRFISDDFDKYVEYWTRLAALKNVSIAGASFGLSNRSDIEDEVKVKAIVAARKKAIRFAEALESSIGTPIRIEEIVEPAVFHQKPMRAAFMESDTGGQPVSPGTETVSAQVQVVFSLQ